MIEFILKYHDSRNGERISEYLKDISRFLHLENHPVQKFENNNFITKKIRILFPILISFFFLDFSVKL